MQGTHVIRPPFGDYLLTPISEVHRTGSSAATTPPRSGSSSWHVESSPERTTTQQSFTPLALERYSHSAVNVAVLPLPALFASQNDTEFAVPGQPSLTLPDFATTPR